MDIEKIDISQFPLKHEVFARKKELGDRLAKMRDLQRKAELAASRRRHHKVFVWSAGLVAAAVVAIAIFMLQTVTVTTMSNEQLITLPCNSTVNVAANSTISYRPYLWKLIGRNVILEEGTAYFSVEKGKRFTVETEYGTIGVLGTEFEVSNQSDAMTVTCFEGRVEVSANEAANQPVELSKGQQVVVKRNEVAEPQSVITEEEIPMEEPEEEKVISYDHEPLINVVEEIERRFDLTVTNKNLCNGISYSGKFYTTDQDMTLKMVIMACGFDFKVKDGKVTLIAIE